MANINFNVKVKAIQDGDLIIGGVASTNGMDKQQERNTVTPKGLKNAIPSWMNNGSPIMVHHCFFYNKANGEYAGMYGDNFNPITHYWQYPEYGNRKVGTVVSLDYEPKEYDLDNPAPPPMKITFVARINDEQAKKDILEGRFSAVSLHYLPDREATLKNVNTGVEVHPKITIRELSLTEPGKQQNPEAVFNIVTDESLVEQYGFAERIGEDVEVYDTMAKVKACVVDNNDQKYYDLDFGTWSAKVKAEKVKAYTTSFDDNSMDNLLIKSLKTKVKEEGYDIPTSEIEQLTYNLKGILTFGKTKRMSVKVTVNSDGKAIFHTKITNATKENKEEAKVKAWGKKEVKAIISELLKEDGEDMDENEIEDMIEFILKEMKSEEAKACKKVKAESITVKRKARIEAKRVKKKQ